MDDPDFRGVVCPHCQSERIELVSLFGGSVSESLLRCKDCQSVFNWVKWRGKLPPAPHAGGEGE